MGLGGISIWQLLIVLAIIVLLFGTKKLRGIGTDLGSAIKGFRNAIKDDAPKSESELQQLSKTSVISNEKSSSPAQQKEHDQL